MLKYLFSFLVLLVFSNNSFAVTSCGDNYKKCFSQLKKAEKLVKALPYDENKSYDMSYPINHMYIYDSMITTFSKKVPMNFSKTDRNLILSLRAWAFYNKLMPVDFFSIAPFKRLWCKNGKADDKNILEVVDIVFLGNQKMKDKFREAIKECGSCSKPQMCEGP